jgi:hypothetical protein
MNLDKKTKISLLLISSFLLQGKMNYVLHLWTLLRLNYEIMKVKMLNLMQ